MSGSPIPISMRSTPFARSCFLSWSISAKRYGGSERMRSASWIEAATVPPGKAGDPTSVEEFEPEVRPRVVLGARFAALEAVGRVAPRDATGKREPPRGAHRERGATGDHVA